MTSEVGEAPVDLSGSMIESVITDTTQRIAEAANAITVKDYSALLRGGP
jgi:hypothetical protein